MLIIPNSPSGMLSRELGSALDSEVAEKIVKRFPDGELYVRIEEDIAGSDVVIVGNTRTDADIMEMLLTLDAAKEASAGRIIAVMPYFGYSRQHRIYNKGEPVSSRVLTKSFSEYADFMYAVDLHDEETLGYSSTPFTNIRIIKSIGNHFKDHGLDYVVSPDDGGALRAKDIAETLNVDTFYLNKVRIDSRTVKMEMPDVELEGKKVLLVDDIISTGGTIMKSASIMRQKGASRVYISAVHGIFTNDSTGKIGNAADEVAVTNTLETEYSTISIAGEVAEKIRDDL